MTPSEFAAKWSDSPSTEKDHFAWEYKGKRANLPAAYKQFLDYREAPREPSLLVVCDFDRFEVHTNFTGTALLPVS